MSSDPTQPVPEWWQQPQAPKRDQGSQQDQGHRDNQDAQGTQDLPGKQNYQDSQATQQYPAGQGEQVHGGLEELDAVHPGHLQIADHEVGAVLLEQLEGTLAAVCGEQVVPGGSPGRGGSAAAIRPYGSR